jgi:hypothetical protein
MVALRRPHRLAQVLFRTKVELLFTHRTAEVISVTFMLGSPCGGSRFYVHAADRIFTTVVLFIMTFLRFVLRLAIDVPIV